MQQYAKSLSGQTVISSTSSSSIVVDIGEEDNSGKKGGKGGKGNWCINIILHN